MTEPLCEIHQKPGGRFGCLGCDESWDDHPLKCKLGRSFKSADPRFDAVMFRWSILSPLELAAIRYHLPDHPLEPDTRYEIEEIQLHAWDRLTQQERNDIMRRIDGVLKHAARPDPERVAAAKELVIRIDRVLRAPADIWAVGDLLPVLTDCGAFISFFVPDAKHAGQLPVSAQTGESDAAKPDVKIALPVDSRSAAHILMLFRAFVIRNATQWTMGAGDHHHPIWERVALEVDGMAEPVAGPEWAFIQPLNRKVLGMLELEHQDLLDEHEATERGG